ncbi:hypothetical protein ACH4VX_34750 [Streptomyces sp. NPDC020731]|uniref:hypothetical protein n=1 Tax=Streptomyces sp. NPDC020731 TaxID=3365085 RepID=UPI00379A307D
MAVYEDPARVLTALIRASHLSAFEDLPTLVAVYADRAGLGRVGIFLADLQQGVLRELTGRGLDAGHGGEELRIDATLAGRAFQQGMGGAVSDGRGRHWVPVLDGTERLGVLRVDAVSTGERAGRRGRIWPPCWACCSCPSAPTATPTPG